MKTVNFFSDEQKVARAQPAPSDVLLLWTNVNKSTFIGYVGQLTFTLLCLYTFVKPISHCGLWSHDIKHSLQRCVHAPVRTRCCKLKGKGSAHTSGCSTAPNQNTYKKWEIFHSQYGWNHSLLLSVWITSFLTSCFISPKIWFIVIVWQLKHLRRFYFPIVIIHLKWWQKPRYQKKTT